MACPPNVVAPGLSARSYTSGQGDRSPPSSENLTRRDPDHAFELAALLAADSLGIGEVPRVGAHDILGFRDRPAATVKACSHRVSPSSARGRSALTSTHRYGPHRERGSPPRTSAR